MERIDLSGFVSRMNEKVRKHVELERELLAKNGECPFKLTLSPVEYDNYLKFLREHTCQFTPTEENPFPAGAIGGEKSLEFAFTSLGAAISVKCGCGAEENITDYELW